MVESLSHVGTGPVALVGSSSYAVASRARSSGGRIRRRTRLDRVCIRLSSLKLTVRTVCIKLPPGSPRSSSILRRRCDATRSSARVIREDRWRIADAERIMVIVIVISQMGGQVRGSDSRASGWCLLRSRLACHHRGDTSGRARVKVAQSTRTRHGGCGPATGRRR